MFRLHHIIGDATVPLKIPSIIMHVCNDVNAFGAGFAYAISRKYPIAKAQYHEWFKKEAPQLGSVQFVQVAEDTCVTNMIAQHDICWQNNIPPIRYNALERCLIKVYEKALKENLVVTAPRIGAVLSGGTWEVIEEIIKKVMTVNTFIYTLDSQKYRWLTDYEKFD